MIRHRRPRRPRRPRPRGFFLIELLIVILLLGVFGLVAARLFHATMMLSFRASRSQNDTASFETAVAALRADVWSGTTINVTDAQSLIVTRGAKETSEDITWSMTGTDLVRGDGHRANHWPIPPGCSFAADGPAVVLTVATSKGQRGGELRFVNESQLVTRLTTR